MILSRITLIFLVIVSVALTVDAVENSPPPSDVIKANPLVWDALEKKLDLPGMTNLARFTFWVTNTSNAEATINSVEAECDCTVVEARTSLPWHIAPGSNGPLNVRVNIRGRFGELSKTITVHTSHGSQVLTVGMKIPLTSAPANVSARQRDVIAARADRQAVFHGSCAACHASPAADLKGPALFQKACGICHMAEHRADFVPDLAALQNLTDEGYWRSSITSGKAGSLMPAFAQSEGGILDSDQIDSLVAFLLKEFPSKVSGASSSGIGEPKMTSTYSPETVK